MIDTDKYEGHREGSWKSDSHLDKKAHSTILDGNENVIASGVAWCNDALIADAPLLLEEVKRLREVLVGESKGWTTDELVEKALTLHDKALVFDIIYDWHTRMQLQGKGIAHNLDRMDWLLKNPTKEYEDYDKEYDEE